MGGEGLGDLRVVGVEGLLEALELAADQLHAQDEAVDDRSFVGDRDGLAIVTGSSVARFAAGVLLRRL